MLITVDVEADGPIPGDYSMVSIGACVVDGVFNKTFRGLLKPISEKWVPEALASCNLTREQTMGFDNPLEVMTNFDRWITNSVQDRPVFISDNNGFDWMFSCWYFHHFIGRNPFGFSSRRIGDIYSGMHKNMRCGSKWKKFRKTAHTHDPVDDAVGNAEAIWEMKKLGLFI